MSVLLRKKFNSIKKEKLSEQAKSVLESMDKATNGFKDAKASRKIQPKFEAFYNKLKESKPEAIATERKAKAPAKKSADDFKAARERRKSQTGVPKDKKAVDKDATRPAISKRGRRVSKAGNTYYEYRDNRLDKNPSKYPMLEKGGYMEKGGYVAVSEKDDYWTIMSKPTTKEKAQQQIDLGVPRGEVGKVVTLKEAIAHKNTIGKEYLEKGGYMADGGKINTRMINKKIKDWYIKNYPTDELGKEINDTITFKGYWGMTSQGYNPYKVLGVPDSVVRERVDEKLSEILGHNKMAKGGGIYSSDSLYYLQVLKDGEEVAREKFRAKSLKEAYEIAEDDYEDKYKSQFGDHLSFIVSEAMEEGGETPKFEVDDVVYHKGHNSVGIVRLGEERGELKTDADGNVNVDELEYYNPMKHESHKNAKIAPSTKKEIEERGLWKPFGERTSKLENGGELANGFSIDEMKEYLNDKFPYSFGFKVYPIKQGTTFSPDYDAEILKGRSLKGLSSIDLDYKKLMFPKYKQSHEINYEVTQGGENTYFEFLLSDVDGNNYYSGTFGFKDQGDVDSEYVTRFIAFLMESYGLPFKVEHSVYSKGGETHRMENIFEEGGEIAEGNNQMVMSQAKAIAHHVAELQSVLTENTEVEAWVVSKMQRAATDLADITHYIDGLTPKSDDVVVVVAEEFAKGGEIRYKLAGNNFGQQIEHGQKFKELITKVYENQSGEHKYPENFIKETAYTGKIVKNDGSYYLKDYMYRGTLTKFEFLDDKDFQEALKHTNRPAIRNFKFEDGGSLDVYEVELEAVPNPDYEDYDDRGSVRIKKHKKKVADVEEARRVVREFIEENELGGGNWPNGCVYKNGKKIGYISYNGKFWPEEKMAQGGRLSRKQKKLDLNKNGKLDSQDFKMLRAGRKNTRKK